MSRTLNRLVEYVPSVLLDLLSPTGNAEAVPTWRLKPGTGNYADGITKKLKKRIDDLPVGLIVGSVEIVGCVKYGHRNYGGTLARPRRCRPIKPKRQPQPSFFWPT